MKFYTYSSVSGARYYFVQNNFVYYFENGKWHESQYSHQVISSSSIFKEIDRSTVPINMLDKIADLQLSGVVEERNIEGLLL